MSQITYHKKSHCPLICMFCRRIFVIRPEKNHERVFKFVYVNPPLFKCLLSGHISLGNLTELFKNKWYHCYFWSGKRANTLNINSLMINLSAIHHSLPRHSCYDLTIPVKQDCQLPFFCSLLQWKPFTNDEKTFLFHLKSPFFTFWSYQKDGLIRKKRLLWKFMTWQSGWQTIKVHIFPNISRSKSNQTMKFSQLI